MADEKTLNPAAADGPAPVAENKDEKTPIEGVRLMAKKKKASQTSEFWTSILAAAATVLAALTSSKTSPLPGSTAAVVSVIGLGVIVGAYAYFKSGFSLSKSGFRTPAFWATVTSIVGSIAMAIGEANIPGLSPTVSKVSLMISTAVIAAGYTIYRWNAKSMAFKASQKPKS